MLTRHLLYSTETRITDDSTHFETLSINQPTKYSAYKRTWCRHSFNFGFFFLRRRCPGQSLIVEELKIGMKLQSDRLICTWVYDF